MSLPSSHLSSVPYDTSPRSRCLHFLSKGRILLLQESEWLDLLQRYELRVFAVHRSFGRNLQVFQEVIPGFQVSDASLICHWTLIFVLQTCNVISFLDTLHSILRIALTDPAVQVEIVNPDPHPLLSIQILQSLQTISNHISCAKIKSTKSIEKIPDTEWIPRIEPQKSSTVLSMSKQIHMGKSGPVEAGTKKKTRQTSVSAAEHFRHYSCVSANT